MTRPLIFSAPMVRALLDGRKTMTRRIIKPRPFSKDGDFVNIDIASRAEFRRGADGRFYFSFEHPRGGPLTAYVAHCAPGDRLWVKEAWQHAPKQYCRCPQGASPSPCDDWLNGTGCAFDRGDVLYRADDESLAFWRSPIHMPRWASRLTLIVERVRVERLQEISEADAIREGVVAQPGAADGCHFTVNADGMHLQSSTARGAFFRLWKTLHPEHDFDDPTGERNDSEIDANPWVAVIGFRAVRENIDAPSASAEITSTE